MSEAYTQRIYCSEILPKSSLLCSAMQMLNVWTGHQNFLIWRKIFFILRVMLESIQQCVSRNNELLSVWHSAQGEELPLYVFESTKMMVFMVMCK